MSKSKTATLATSEFRKYLSVIPFRPAPLYLLFGNEPKRVRDATEKLRDLCIKNITRDNYFHYSALGSGAEDVSAGDIIAGLNTVSMFSAGAKLVVAGPMDKPSKDDAERFIEYCADPSPDNILIISITTPKGDKKSLRSFATSKLVKQFLESGAVVAKFEPPRGEELVEWVTGRLTARGIDGDRQGVELLIDHCDKDLTRLSMEIEKISDYVGAGGRINEKLVLEVVKNRHEEELWDYLDAVRGRNITKALVIISSLERQNLPIQMIQKMVVVELGRLLLACECKSSGISLAEFAKKAGMAPFIAEKNYRSAERWNENSVRKGVTALLDSMMRTMKGRISSADVLTEMTMKLTL